MAPEAAGLSASVAHVQPKLRLPRLVVRAVALEAVPRQDRPDPAGEQILFGAPWLFSSDGEKR